MFRKFNIIFITYDICIERFKVVLLRQIIAINDYVNFILNSASTIYNVEYIDKTIYILV